MNFGALEWALIQGIRMMAENEAARYENTTLPTMFGDRLKLFDKMVRGAVNDAACLEAHAAVVTELERIANDRNDLIHGAWFDVPGTNIDEVKYKLPKKKLKLGELKVSVLARGVTPAEVGGAVGACHEALKSFNDHLVRINKALPKDC
jgi:hypothetical protein